MKSKKIRNTQFLGVVSGEYERFLAAEELRESQLKNFNYRQVCELRIIKNDKGEIAKAEIDAKK